MTKATHKKTRVDIMKSQKRQQKKAYGLGRQNLTGYTDVAGGFTTMHQVSSASSGGSNQTAPINAVGAVNFMDPIAFWMDIQLLYPTSPDNTLDLGEGGAFTSHWVWAALGSEELEIIANASHSGQILFIESVDTRTPKIVDRSNTSGGDTGNIKTLDGEDFTFPSNKTIVLFMFSSIDNLWHQVSNPAAGGATTELDNLGTTSINADLLPQSTKDLGSSSNRWTETHTTDFYIYAGTASSGSSVSLDGYVRMWVNGADKWIPYYE